MPKPVKNQIPRHYCFLLQVGQDPVPSKLCNDSNYKDSELAQGLVRPLIIVIVMVLHEENTYPRNKNVILEYVMSSVKFPLHFYNT